MLRKNFKQFLNSFKNSRKAILIGLALLLLIGFAAGVIATKYGNFILGKACIDSQLIYLNPQITCDTKPVVNKRNYMTLKNQIRAFIDQEKQNGNLSEAAIYFRDLQNGPTMGIDEYALFSPASLFKLPVLLTYLSLEEKNPELAQTKLVYQLVSDPYSQTFFPSKSVEENKPYTVDELLEYLIKYSDNRANYVLLQYLRQTYPNKNFLSETLLDLGIIDTATSTDQIITVKSYASIFVQLYYATFFDQKQTSEKALDYLVDTDFERGLVAGLPAGLKVAHKFGERFSPETEIKQLHDCGIIYYPGNPYLLCVMTRGKDFNKLADFISSTSKMVYEEFDSRRMQK